MMVTSLSLGLEMVLVAIMPGMAQAKLESKGKNERPLKPTEIMILSRRKAARGK